MIKIAITTPVKNRAWILPSYLAALEAAAQGFDAAYFFVDDGSTDATVEILTAWLQTHPGTLHCEPSSGEDNTSSRDARQRQACYRRLSGMRNRLIDDVLATDAQWQLAIDSDILLAPWAIRHLMAHQLPYVAAIVDNMRTIPVDVVMGRTWPDSQYNAMIDAHNASWTPLRTPPRNTLLPVALTGACALIARHTLETPARFSAHLVGEDAGYALALQAAGVTLHLDTHCLALHVYAPRDLALARASFAALLVHGAR